MVTRRSMIALGGATALAVSTGHMTGDAKKKKKSKVVTRTFSNAASIALANLSVTPYPSSIQVSGFKKGKIQKVRVHLNGYSYNAPDDIDVMLAGAHLPGLTAIIMSDVGAALAVNNVNLILDDEAANLLPDSAQLTSGTYKPANFNTGSPDNFAPPAPSPNGNSALSVFNGANPNGEWQLWIHDWPGNGPGAFAGGWSIEITAKVKKKKKK